MQTTFRILDSFKSIAIAMSAFNEVHWVAYSLTELIQMNLSSLGI